MLRKKFAIALASVMMVSMFAGCSSTTTTTTAGSNETTQESKASETKEATKESSTEEALTGSITIDGSSTVYPLTEAIAEEFGGVQGGVKVTVSGSGSGTGLKKLVAGEIPIAGASRKIKDKELASAKEKGIEIVEIKVAIDGIAVVVNKDNKVDAVTVDELNKAWNKDSKVKSWKELNPSFEDAQLKLFSPGAASGTFEYFTEHINKKAKEQRTDGVQTSEDDNVLVTGVAGDKGAMGYFGFSYFEENMDKLKALKIDGVDATSENIISGKYPLARPLFIYVNKKDLEEKKEVKAFVKFYLENAGKLAKEIKMIAQPDDVYTKQIDELKLK